MTAKRCIKKIGMFLQQQVNNIYNISTLSLQHVKHGNNFLINGRIFCVSNSIDGIRIGENVTINSCFGSNPIGGDERTVLFAKGEGKIIIGDNVGISNSAIIATTSVKIGNNVMIGGNVKIYDTDFHWIEAGKRMEQPGGMSQSVIIEDEVFIGAHSIILKGVTIGQNSVIGAGSVVAKNIPDNEIWAGNPVRFIRKI